MIDSLGSKAVCVSLAPATFVVTSAASINTNVQPLNGQPGIEIMLPPSQVAAYDGAMEKSFRRPVSVTADGKIIYLITIEPNAAGYMPIGPALIVYTTPPEIGQIELQLSGLERPSQ